MSRIIDHKREHLAADCLGLDVMHVERPSPGPRDAARGQRLVELLRRVSDPAPYHGNAYALAEDYRRCAMLARGLEKPRHEIDGLFSRALQISKNHGYRGQILRIGYDFAWTALWWFDDAKKHAQLYSDIEGCIAGTFNPEDCTLLARHWHLLMGSVRNGVLTAVEGKLEERLAVIKRELERLAEDTLRPNSALQAQTELHLLDLHLVIEDPARAEVLFKLLKECLLRSEQLGAFPAMDLIEFLSQAGEIFGDLPGYDSLFDTVRQVAKRRLGDTQEGSLLFDRGLQLARVNRPKEALLYFGKARVRLFKEETKQEQIRATLACADAYTQLGLYWAARMDALTAAHGALGSRETIDELPFEGVYAATKMAWLELQLGRVFPFLAWHEIARILVGLLESRRFTVDKLAEPLEMQAGVLGSVFLRMDSETARQYRGLEATLGRMGLRMARLALLSAMGDDGPLSQEWPTDGVEGYTDCEEFIADWKRESLFLEVPARASGETGKYVWCEASILGVSYRVRAINQFGPIAFAENLLGVLEATLARAAWENLAFIVDEVEIHVEVDKQGKNPPLIEFPAGLKSQVFESIWAPDMLTWINSGDRERVVQYLKQVFFSLLLSTTIDPREELQAELKVWYNEEAPSRAFGTSPITIALVDVIGDDKYDPAYWCEGSAASQIRRTRGDAGRA